MNNKQIKDLGCIIDNCIKGGLIPYEIAEYLYEKGYRKQSETVKEFAEKVTDVVFPETMKYINTDIGKGMAKVIVEINKLAEEFGGEVE